MNQNQNLHGHFKNKPAIRIVISLERCAINAFNKSTPPCHVCCHHTPRIHHRVGDMITIYSTLIEHSSGYSFKCCTKYWNTAMSINMVLRLALLWWSSAVYHNICSTDSINTIYSDTLLNIMWTNSMAVAHKKPLCILAVYKNIKSSCNHSSFFNK